MDKTGRARIADFGLATLAENPCSIKSLLGQRGYSPQWAAPEVLDKGGYSKEADIFSFAMVMIGVRHRRPTMCRTLVDRCSVSTQIFTGNTPFGNSGLSVVVLEITQGNRPPRPTHQGLTEDLWVLMQFCWDHNPRVRLRVSEVLQVLQTPLVFCSSQRPSFRRLDCFLCVVFL